MLTISAAQVEALGEVERLRFVESMCLHLRNVFPKIVASLDDQAVKCRVEYTLRRAAVFGLSSRQDLCRYLNLAALFGWDFDRNPHRAWMRHYLTDEQVSRPSERLARLVKESAFRNKLQEKNRALREEFGQDEDPLDDSMSEFAPHAPLTLLDKESDT